MAEILDLINKSWINVVEIYFIGFVDTENISLGTKSIHVHVLLPDLEIKISEKFDLMYGHGGHVEKNNLFGHFLRGVELPV